MPVAIVGMHRSGTSLLAQMLRCGGLFLGSDDQLLGPRPDNPEGFWEHTGFQDLNEAVLAGLGGRWDAPPAVPARWGEDPRLAAQHHDARQLLNQFRGREPWGWKDPRTSLTLSLWRDLIPNLRVILCLRNPLEVAVSLRRRNGFSYTKAIGLWRLYNDRALATATERIVVSYERILSAAEFELARVLKFIGIDASAQTLRDAANACRDDLRHVHYGQADLHATQCHSDVIELYTRLAAEAGIGHTVDAIPGPNGLSSLVNEQALEGLAARQGVTAGAGPDDTAQISRIRKLVADATATGATVAVISRGDDRLVDLCGRRGQHFPRDSDGAPLGYHPCSGPSAVTHLEAARAEGAEYLLIPGPSLWWLEHYPELRRHLEARYRSLRWEAETAALFDLRESPEPSVRTPEAGSAEVGLSTPEREPAAVILAENRGSRGVQCS
jgi:hypothetical protein